MQLAHSIRVRLALVFGLLFLLLIALGLESLGSLSRFNDASAQIRVRWLPSTRALGDLNNYTTDFPAAEAALLRGEGAVDRAAILHQMAALDGGIAAAQRAYRTIAHDAAETELSRCFDARWNEYRRLVAAMADAPPHETRGWAYARLQAQSKTAYEAASAILGRLTDGNVTSAREASERSERAYYEARSRITLTVLLAGLLIAGAMVHVTRSISAPLVELAEKMHRLAESETRVEIRGTKRFDEIGEMARAVVVFRNNAVDLAQNRHALAQQAAVLRAKLAEEQRLTMLQRNFVSMASHEFLTPLAIIDGHAQRLISLKDRLTAQELAERARKVRDGVRRMTQMIDNLIGSARSIDGRFDLNYRPKICELAAIVREACALQRELSPDALILERVAPPLVVLGDAGLLSQLFGNLLSNAVKYSPDIAAITLSAGSDDSHAIIVIEDRGIGIPAAERERVFERYFRGSNTSGIVGSGVGLSLVKTIVDLHGGSISLDSREGQGSRFTLRLPLKSAGLRRAVFAGPRAAASRPEEHDLV
jgi:signal transduction histidine kinase